MTASNPSRGGAEEMEEAALPTPSREHDSERSGRGDLQGGTAPFVRAFFGSLFWGAPKK